MALWASFGAGSAIVIGMYPALLNPHKPEQDAVAVLEEAVTALREVGNLSVGKRHQAETALANAWIALTDSRVVRGGEIIDPTRAELAQRAVAAQHELATLSSGTEAQATAGDVPTYVDSSRLAIPHARPSASFRLYRSAHQHSHASVTTVRVLVAALTASVAGVALGFDRPDWAIVSAVVMLQWGPDLVAGTIRGVHRMVGSIIGIGVFAVIFWLDPNPWGLLFFLTLAQFFAEIFVVRNYAITVIATTPLALLMGGATHGELWPTVLSRIAETAIATVFSLLALWLCCRRSEAIRHHQLMQRCSGAMGNLVGALTTQTADQALAYRRDLQYELLGERGAIQSLAANSRPVAAQRWPRHLALQDTGYKLLDYCTANAHRELTLTEVGKLASAIRATARAGEPSPESH